jgi:nucleotide-binding universal stress UspA family protein
MIKKLNKILFPHDFSECAGQAFTHAIYFAKKYDAELHLLHVVTLFEDAPQLDEKNFPDKENLQKRFEEISSSKMKGLKETYESDKLNIITSVKRAISEAPEILDYSTDNDIDLIVTGTHGRRGIGHLFMGSVAEEVVRLSNVPVFTIKETENPKPIKNWDKILVPVDFSEHSQTALAHAKSIAESYDATLQLLHVIEEPVHPALSIAGKSSIFDIVPDLKEDCRKRIHNMIKESKGPDVKAEIFIIEGNATNDILRFAEENNSDLIVIATHGLTGLEHMLLGSVTEKVVRMAHCPVFTVKAFGKQLIG